MIENNKIFVVVPAFNIGEPIVKFIASIPDFVDQIYLVDDNCPLKTGRILSENLPLNKKIDILFNEKNLGVGGSVKRGYLASIKSGADIVVKIDGDGQMDPNQIIKLINPILKKFDYSKGNRFLENKLIKNYPVERYYGNMFLSFLTKFSSGYWDIYDPINGFTAIDVKKLKELDFNQIDEGYYFESDMLFNLYLEKSTIKDVPVTIKYFKGQVQNLSVIKESPNFLFKNLHRIYKRINVCYLSKNFGLPGLIFYIGLFSLLFSFFYGGVNWFYYSQIVNINAPNGTVIFSAISLITGLFAIIYFLILDSNSNPNKKNG